MKEDTRLPFAVDDNGNSRLPIVVGDHQSGSLVTVQVDRSVCYPPQSALPGLESSILSCRSEDTTQVSSTMSEGARSAQWPETKASVFGGDMASSGQLDAAVSLVAESYLPHISLYDPVKSTLPMANGDIRSQHFPSALSPGSFSSLEFSRLMQHADDSHGQSRTLKREPVLPILQEETDDSIHCTHGDSPSPFLSSLASTSSYVISPAWLQVDDNTLPKERGYQPPQLLNHVMGEKAQAWQRSKLDQSVLRTSGVKVYQLDSDSFKVSADLSTGCTIDEVMNVVTKPENLVLWCDSIRSLVITSRSEGNTDALARDEMIQNGRQYDGEWIEATTTELVSPRATSCLYSAKKAMWNYVGFPSNYGTISMFVERQRGRVGLSVGPFDGGITVSHSISVTNTKITNTITLTRVASSMEVLCGLFERLEQFFLPALQGYTDQIVSSMIRLRLLIETGKRGSSGASDSSLQGGLD